MSKPNNKYDNLKQDDTPENLFKTIYSTLGLSETKHLIQSFNGSVTGLST